jgi:two-component system response regulator AtoC
MSRILIVDDNAALREQYAYDLTRLGGHECLQAEDGDAALALLAREPADCVVLDLEMPGTDGFGVLRRLQERDGAPPVIVYTGTGDYAHCVRAVKLGAYGFIDKHEPVERVVREVENALAHGRLAQEVASLKRRLAEETRIVGRGAAITAMKARLAKLAPIPSPVLVLGESGTGKELVAAELHRLGASPRGPFVAVNCAALPENLVESELFGHEKGAFTGADRQHRGAFERAHGGTLFLDEIGELPATAQAKLLRVLEQGELQRVGGTQTVKTDARVVAATNRDLDAAVRTGRFREDLLYRLNVHVISVPPLRERTEDVPGLVDHFLRLVCEKYRARHKSVSPEALALLTARDWRRNNVRELRNVVEQMVMAADGDVIGPDDLPSAPHAADAASTSGGTLEELRSQAERRIVAAALERNGWHLTNTARELGLADHASLSKVLKRLDLKRP